VFRPLLFVFNNPDLMQLMTDVELLQHWTKHAKNDFKGLRLPRQATWRVLKR